MKFGEQKAIYLQIADYICEQILRKELNSNDKVLSIRDLAVAVAVNPNTVVKAYNFLEEKEIIYKERGLGYFVTKDGLNNSLQLKKDSFLKEHLPEIFKSIHLLKFNFADLQHLYTKYLEKNNEK